MSASYKRWAPRCTLPDCNNLVSYHKKNGNSIKWKMFCEPHRTIRKAEVDSWKMKTGCENIDAHHGFKCTSHITDASQLDINHVDGDRQNGDSSNLEILCKVCHQRVTVDNGHQNNRYSNQVILDPALFEFD